MSFLYPAFLIGGLAIAVPIVLHLLRRDVAPELPFSAVHLLHKTPIERSSVVISVYKYASASSHTNVDVAVDALVIGT